MSQVNKKGEIATKDLIFYKSVIVAATVLLCIHPYLEFQKYGLTGFVIKDLICLALLVFMIILNKFGLLSFPKVLTILVYSVTINAYLTIPLDLEAKYGDLRDYFFQIQVIYLTLALAIGIYVKPINKLVLLILNTVFIVYCAFFTDMAINTGMVVFYGLLITFCGYAGYRVFMQAVLLVEKNKEAELALLETNKELYRLNEFKDSMFQIIGHDVRTPFSQIKILLELYSDFDSTEKEKDELIAHIKESNQSGLLLLQDLLNWTKNQDNQNMEKREVFLVKDLVDETIKFIEFGQQFKKVSIVNNIDASLAMTFSKPTLDTIVRNLISNATKYVNNNGLIVVEGFQKGERTHLTITDNGIGMSKGILDKLLNKDSYYTSEGTTLEKGSGFGMNICKTLLERNNAKILILSEEGEGTHIELIFPDTCIESSYTQQVQ